MPANALQSIFPERTVRRLNSLQSPRRQAAFHRRAIHAIRRSGELLGQFQRLCSPEIVQVVNELKFRFRSNQFHHDEWVASINLVRMAIKNQLGLSIYDEQLLAGLALFQNQFVEMATGEGKTLAAILPLFMRALSGQNVWLATANDYLAERDAQWTRPVFEQLGLSVASVCEHHDRDQRIKRYQSNIVYSTITQIGFDYLRDRLSRRSASTQQNFAAVQPGFYSLIVDEVDSLLIDDATTPLVISSSREDSRSGFLFQWAASIADRFKCFKHFQWDEKARTADLTTDGMRLARVLWPDNETLPGDFSGNQTVLELYEFVERAIMVAQVFGRDRDYIVRDGKLVIIDTATGRVAEQRQFSRGVHQALEARENLQLSFSSEKVAQVSIQSLVLKFPHLAGMSGTIGASAKELQVVFGRKSTEIPTHQPVARRMLPTRVVLNQLEKIATVVDEIVEVQNAGRPVLVGTASVKSSESLSAELTKRCIEHQLLNARHDKMEAELISNAGRAGRVTIATNIAGRGTDIKLESDVRARGGLHVIVAEMHHSERIDRQLIGRCGRQGDPATARLIIAKDDVVLAEAFGEETVRRWLNKRSRNSDQWWVMKFKRAQQILENRRLLSRRQLLYCERQKQKAQVSAGLDPMLDNFDE